MAEVDLRRLRYFVAVCEHHGFSRASSFIGVAQPGLTRQIKLLEKEIGLPLINRTGRGAEPTEEGRFLLTRSRKYLDGLDEIVRELKNRSSGLSGQLTVGMCPTVAPFFLGELTAHMREHHPNVTLAVIEAYGADLQTLMRKNELDLALSYRADGPPPNGSIDLFSERLVLATRYQPDSEDAEMPLPQIRRKRLILPSAVHGLRRIVNEVGNRRGLLLTPELELDSLEAIKAMLLKKSPRYFAILPRHSVQHDGDDRLFSFVHIQDSGMRRIITLVLPKDARRSRRSSFLVEHIHRMTPPLKAKFDTHP